jgi:hypothetical protein
MIQLSPQLKQTDSFIKKAGEIIKQNPRYRLSINIDDIISFGDLKIDLKASKQFTEELKGSDTVS